ncbi:unnamed protein product, partial [Meganyctiphanes norvegica]
SYIAIRRLFAIMDQKLNLLMILISCIGAEAKTCYYCYTKEGYNSPYDPDCGNPNYNGTNTITYSTAVGCAMQIYDDGNVFRGTESQRYADEHDACQYWDHMGTEPANMRCWCPDDLCNSYLCEECFTTPPTTDTPTTTTYIPNSTQEPPNKGLSCYDCFDCPTVDESTKVAYDEKFLTCVTIMTSHEKIIRIGSYDAHPDGHCYLVGSVSYCHCTSSFCNGINVAIKSTE